MGKTNAGHLARRPDNSAFKQQRLPAWSPMLTAHTVLPFFYLMSALCVLLGAVLLHTVQNTHELKVDYTDAGSCRKCLDERQNVSLASQSCTCAVDFTIDKTFEGNVFFYYGLINFHQNLRRYMDSRDDAQMVGRKNKLQDPSTYCAPFRFDKNNRPIAPCGAVANSMFNDSFTLRYHQKGGDLMVPLFRKGISWYTDKNVKFRNPQVEDQTLAQVLQGTSPPPYWQKPVYELDPLDPNNNGFINEDLIVWMREAAFPRFKKLYGVLNRAMEPFTDGLPPGNYSVDISYNFPVQYFQGRKEVVLTTVSWFGGQNRFLPIAFLVTGGLLLLMGVALTAVWWKFGKDGRNMEE